MLDFFFSAQRKADPATARQLATTANSGICKCKLSTSSTQMQKVWIKIVFLFWKRKTWCPFCPIWKTSIASKKQLTNSSTWRWRKSLRGTLFWNKISSWESATRRCGRWSINHIRKLWKNSRKMSRSNPLRPTLWLPSLRSSVTLVSLNPTSTLESTPHEPLDPVIVSFLLKGIGKSYFCCYLMWRLVNQRIPFVYR